MKTKPKKKAPTAVGQRARKTQGKAAKAKPEPAAGGGLEEAFPVPPFVLTCPKRVEAPLFPSLGELARLAAVLAASNRPRLVAPSLSPDSPPADLLAHEALALWGECRRALLDAETKEDDRFASEEEALAEAYAKEDSMMMENKMSFPIPFEDGLVALVGKKVRLSDRHNRFRELLRYAAKEKGVEEGECDAYAERWMAKLKESGFTETQFFRTRQMHESKKAFARMERARRGGNALKTKREEAKAKAKAAKQANGEGKQSAKKT